MSELELPDECWERVFRFVVDDHHRYLEPLSLVSKQFLSITNRLRFSLTIVDETVPFLPRLFHRFPSLSSLDLSLFCGYLHLLLLQISRLHLSLLCLKSLNLSRRMSIPANALRVFSKKFPTLTSLNCSHMRSLTDSDLLLISRCFPLLQELDVSDPSNWDSDEFLYGFDGVMALSLALPKLRKVNLSGNTFVDDSNLFSLCKNCWFLEEVSISVYNHWVTEAGIASAIRERPGLISLSVRYSGRLIKNQVSSDFIASLVSLKSLTCLEFYYYFISDELLCSVADEGLPLRKLVLNSCINYSYNGIFSLLSKCQLIQHLELKVTEFLTDQHVAELSVFLRNLISIHLRDNMLTISAFLALARNCPLLNDFEMSWDTGFGKMGIKENSFIDCSIVKPLVKRLCLRKNEWLTDEIMTMFASICPNLESLDLSFCKNIPKGVVEVLRRCPKIRHLSLKYCEGVKLYGLDFQVPNLEVLELLSHSIISDEELSVISKCCPGLLELDLVNCDSDFTTKGVRELVEKCTKLKHKYGDLL